MQLVEGDSCPYAQQRCVDWIDVKRDRCRRYAPDPRCVGRRRPMRFCIDRYEFPNQKGVYPAVMVDFVQAQTACKAEGKRLCSDQEWTFACEGTELRPYPYGFQRDATACNIDRPYRLPDLQAFSQSRDISSELSRLDQRVQSGSMGRCVSPFGVYDMTGNVDEWVVNKEAADSPVDERTSDISGLKGGYFGPVRDRCRPMTTDHNRWFRFYQVGFRCCSNPARSD
jgi:formylglycine-generating enzyme required for sulfatase activity